MWQAPHSPVFDEVVMVTVSGHLLTMICVNGGFTEGSRERNTPLFEVPIVKVLPLLSTTLTVAPATGVLPAVDVLWTVPTIVTRHIPGGHVEFEDPGPWQPLAMQSVSAP